MNKRIYRTAALERLASPEQLDLPIRMVSPIGWIAAIFFFISLIGAIIWSATALAPVKVKGQGLLITQGGILEIVADKNGHLKEFILTPGMDVTAGMIIGAFSQTELQREYSSAKAALKDARARKIEIEKFYFEATERDEKSTTERLATIRQVSGLIRNRLVLLQEKLMSINDLLKRKIVIKDRLIQIQLEISAARERLARLDDEEKTVILDQTGRDSTRHLSILDENLKVSKLKRQVELIRSRLSENETLRSPHSGRILEIKVGIGDVVTPGTALAVIAPKQTTQNSKPEVVIYVLPTEGKRIVVGQDVELIPSTARPERFGYMLAKVTRVATLPSTIAGMQAVLKNDQLVTQLAGGGAPFEIRVQPISDALNFSGYKWSSSSGPQVAILPGTLMQAKIIVERRRLVGMIAPGLDGVIDNILKQYNDSQSTN